MRPIRLGIIGTGIAAQKLHWPHLKAMPELFEIVALCNHNPEKAHAFAEEIGAEPFITADYRELLARSDVEAVDIALPIFLNEEVTCATLTAGKHVIVEKPIAGTAEGGRRVVQMGAEHPEQVLLLAENVRYQPRFQLARDLIAAGRIERPVLIHADVLQPLQPTSPYVQTSWRQQPQHLGGFLSDGGVHQTAGLHMLGGRIETVQGITTSFHSHSGAPDTLMLNGVFSSGAVGHLTYSVGVYAQEEALFRVYGSTGTLVVHRNRVTVRTNAGNEDFPVDENVNGIELEFRDFHAAIVEGRPPLVSPADGLDDLLVVDAVFRSFESGRSVQVHGDVQD